MFDSCIQADFEKLYLTWLNHTNRWNNLTLFEDFLCRLTKYDSIKFSCHTNESYLVLIFGLFGFLGSIASLILFSWRPFLNLDFSLYRLIGFLEIIHTSLMATLHQIKLIDRCDSDYACVFFRAHIHLAITNTCAETVDCIVLFLTIERIVACLFPTNFKKIHKGLIYEIIIVFSLILAMFFNFCQAFDVDVVERSSGDVKKFIYIPSAFANSPFYQSISQINVFRTAFIGSALAVATCLSILGLIKTEYHKNQILKQSPNERTPDLSHRLKRIDKNFKRTIDLCCLQLCLAIPILINYSVYAMTLQDGPTTLDSYKIAENAFRNFDDRNNYETALSDIRKATNRQYLRLATNISNILAHSAYFYLYLLFCKKIRSAGYRLLNLTKNRFEEFLHCAKEKKGELTLSAIQPQASASGSAVIYLTSV